MSLRLPRLDARLGIGDNQGRPTFQMQRLWQKMCELLEANADANDELNASQTIALDLLNDMIEQVNAIYGITGPGVYTITSSQTLPDDCRTALVDTSGGAVTLTLTPSAENLADVVVKKMTADANNVVVDGDGSETIDGAATLSFSTQYQSFTLRPANSNWVIV